MKKIVFASLLALGAGRSWAQSHVANAHAYESLVTYQKTQQKAALIEVPYPDQVVESSIREYMSRQGYRNSNSRGYMVFHSIRLTDTANGLNDIHIDVEKKNKDRTVTIITALVAQPGEDPAARATRENYEMSRVRVYLEKMVPALAAGDLEARIKEQAEVARKSQDKMADLREDQLDLEKKIRGTQSDLADNKAAQEKETLGSQGPGTKETAGSQGPGAKEAAGSQGPGAKTDAKIDTQADLKVDAKTAAKAQKKMKQLADDRVDLEKKLQKHQASLEENKKNQQFQLSVMGQQQHTLDSLKAMRRVN